MTPATCDPALHIVLVRPEIPQNSGSIGRLAAATRTRLHLVGPLGFSLADRYLKRAGLDYWPLVDLRSYPTWQAFDAMYDSLGSGGFKYFSARARKNYLEAEYRRGDWLVFGSETKGLGAEFLRPRAADSYRIPIFEPGVRSLNLANAVSTVLYEALRQLGLLTER
ncbi:MAG: tRNA (cytidine(34)-2'-O)-methyltransferase [Candidatus Binataceae bacterium]